MNYGVKSQYLHWLLIELLCISQYLLVIFVLKCICTIKYFACIPLNPAYLLNYGVKSQYFTLITCYICLRSVHVQYIFACIPLKPV